MSDIEVPKGHGKWHGGKGSAPKQSNQEKYADNWDRIFKKDVDAFPDRAMPDGLSWEQERREKNEAQLKHEEKVFGKPPMPNGLERAWARKEGKDDT